MTLRLANYPHPLPTPLPWLRSKYDETLEKECSQRAVTSGAGCRENPVSYGLLLAGLETGLLFKNKFGNT